MAQLTRNAPAPVNTLINSGVQSSICVDNADGSLANYNPVQIWSCNGSPQQRWVFQPNGTVTTAPSSSNCLDVYHSGLTNGTLVELHGCDTSGSMQWQVLPNGSLMNPESGKCLNDPGSSTTNGTQLQIYTCNGTGAQTWSSLVQPAENPPVGTILNLQTGFCGQNAGGSATSAGSTTPPSAAQVGTCNGYLSQQLTFQPNGTITVAGLCLNNTGGNTNDGNTINFTTCNGTNAQVWTHPDSGAIKNPTTGKCVQGGTTTGAGFQLWTCDNAADQTWLYASTRAS